MHCIITIIYWISIAIVCDYDFDYVERLEFMIELEKTIGG